ncbi:hypothetical protein GQ43DRAFT_225769 [Delitschia confertaspora ATCC 74209]|uniref:Nuclear pore complex component n=1 Tax=Delitschia confertaspora ATCC 74209 TaxID=1513339 RepID=A0A9P4JV28_9PLEO|nr:hypothetical protein GQ43DRAFT_225769 [Delitschia confertaspora ATCC 74209]
MVTPATPATPAAQTQSQPTPTGKWRHPQFDEITRRQYATTFDDRNIRNYLLSLSKAYAPWSVYLVAIIRTIFLLNVLHAFLPLIRRYYTDDLADIPLTPSQRQAMGLNPNVSTPATPGSALSTYASSNYVTPPRYQKSTPRSSLSNQGRSSGSPLSGTGSPRGLGESTTRSPFSPNGGGSPLFQRALGRTLSHDRQSSPFGNSTNSLFSASSSSNAPSTPTPSVGKASVGLNNKWLYERGRGSPRGSLFS